MLVIPVCELRTCFDNLRQPAGSSPQCDLDQELERSAVSTRDERATRLCRHSWSLGIAEELISWVEKRDSEHSEALRCRAAECGHVERLPRAHRARQRVRGVKVFCMPPEL